MSSKNYFFTSESVSEGHPDKLCDQVSDAILDAMLIGDPKSRVACECYATTGLIVVGGEITSETWVDLPPLVREVIRDIGYNHNELRFDADSIGVINLLESQSPDIAMGVDVNGAGDQGIMFGYAINETSSYLPATLEYAHKLVYRLADVRKFTTLMPYLRPDAKSQVTIEYTPEGKIARIDTIVISTQHAPEVDIPRIKEDCVKYIIADVIPKELIDDKTKIYVNPTGRFVIGGPHGDTGLTGRKIIVDTYGGKCQHGGGAFSGKDPTKVDRSAAYAARHLAKNIVAAGVATECTIQFSYAIGVPEPTSVWLDIKDKDKAYELGEFIKKEFDLSPRGIITSLDLLKPIFRRTSNYGHFGRDGFNWEKLDLLDKFKKFA
ncbi:MAG: methionine adenosyltransferase [Ignavibacteria bacterium]|jgi:S-adenosylmethionine synthetase|nr:methionine adenosyltransferase [Ignavibacteria bacterium]